MEKASNWWQRVRSDRPIGCINKILPFFNDAPAPESTDDIWEPRPTPASAPAGCYDNDVPSFPVYERELNCPLERLVGYESVTSVPSLLLVCHESNAVAAPHYCRTFSSLGAKPQTYFNFEQDTLYVASSVFGSFDNVSDTRHAIRDRFTKHELDRVRKLAICWLPRDSLAYGGHLEEWYANVIYAFEGIEELSIVDSHLQYGTYPSVAERKLESATINHIRTCDDLIAVDISGTPGKGCRIIHSGLKDGFLEISQDLCQSLRLKIRQDCDFNLLGRIYMTLIRNHPRASPDEVRLPTISRKRYMSKTGLFQLERDLLTRKQLESKGREEEIERRINLSTLRIS